MLKRVFQAGSMRSRMVALTAAMAIPMAPSAVLAARMPVVFWASPMAQVGQSSDQPTWDSAGFTTTQEFAPSQASAEPAPVGPMIDVAGVYYDPAVQRVNDELEASGFTLVPAALHAGRDAEGRATILFGIDENGGAKVHNAQDSLWTDALRLGVVAVLDEHDLVQKVVEVRMTKDPAGNLAIMWEAELDEDQRTRVIDRYIDGQVHREVTLRVRDADGVFVTVSDVWVDGITWRCVRDCIRDQAIRIGVSAAICLAVCLVAAGITIILTGGAAAIVVLKACGATCARSVLAAIKAAAAAIVACITRC